MKIIIKIKYTNDSNVPYPTFDLSLYSLTIKLVTLSVAPPGPPAVTIIIISANFNLKLF